MYRWGLKTPKPTSLLGFATILWISHTPVPTRAEYHDKPTKGQSQSLIKINLWMI
jgi:hypothetical protein